MDEKVFENHTHRCETKMLHGEHAKCNFSRDEGFIERCKIRISLGLNPFVKNREMGGHDLCDYCTHMRTVFLSDDRTAIARID